MSIERIDNDGDYEKSNCKWATAAEQNKNHRVDRDPVTNRMGVYCSQWAPEYRAWMSMRTRVSKGNKRMADLHADRGITVCPEWRKSFEQFKLDMGPIPHPGWTLDRIDNDKGYYKENCRWANCQTQAQNRRQNQVRWPRKAA